MFDTSKKELLNPNKGYKKIVQKIKNKYKVRIPPLLTRPNPAIVRDQQDRDQTVRLEKREPAPPGSSHDALL
jgi:hypothetical protein